MPKQLNSLSTVPIRFSNTANPQNITFNFFLAEPESNEYLNFGIEVIYMYISIRCWSWIVKNSEDAP